MLNIQKYKTKKQVTEYYLTKTRITDSSKKRKRKKNKEESKYKRRKSKVEIVQL